MRNLILYLVIICGNVSGQNNDLIQQFFSDKANFAVTTLLGGKEPGVYFVLKQTAPWNIYRFKISEIPLSDSALKKMKQNEYHPYNHTYLFKDTALSNLFTENEKDHLHNTALQLKARPLDLQTSNVKLIASYANAPNGFFFQLSEPVVSSDGKYAFVDMAVYEKTKYTKKLSDAYFATVCVLYRKSAIGWEKLKVIQYLFL